MDTGGCCSEVLDMWLNEPLDDVLSSRGKVAVLRVLSSTTVPLNGREVARRAGLVAGHAHRLLAELVSAGLVLRRDQGRVNTYEFVDPQSAITRGLRDLFATEARRRHDFLRALSATIPEVLSVVLFGSEARGDAKPGNDTDLLFLVERKTKRLEDRISSTCLRLATEHQLALSWLVADLREVRTWEAEGNDFWRNVQTEGLRLAGQFPGRLLG